MGFLVSFLSTVPVNAALKWQGVSKLLVLQGRNKCMQAVVYFVTTDLVRRVVFASISQDDNYDIPTVSLLLGIKCQQGIKRGFVVLNYIESTIIYSASSTPSFGQFTEGEGRTIKVEKQKSSRSLRQFFAARPAGSGDPRGREI